MKRINTKEFVEYLEANNIKVYKYKGGYYKAFFGKAYITFDTTPTIGNILINGRFPDFSILKAIVERFLEEKKLPIYYDKSHGIISITPFKTYTEEEVLKCFEEVFS